MKIIKVTASDSQHIVSNARPSGVGQRSMPVGHFPCLGQVL